MNLYFAMSVNNHLHFRTFGKCAQNTHHKCLTTPPKILQKTPYIFYHSSMQTAHSHFETQGRHYQKSKIKDDKRP